MNFSTFFLQDNRVLAELEQPRTSASASMSGLPPSSMMNTGNSEFRTISKSGKSCRDREERGVQRFPQSFVVASAELEEELNRYKRAVLGGASGGGSAGGGAMSALSSGYSGLPQSLASTLANGASNSLSGTSVGSQSAAAAAAAAAAMGAGGITTTGGLSSISAQLVPNSISGAGISSSLSSHAIQSLNAAAYGAGQTSVEKLLSGTSGMTGIPPLPVNIHTMKAMPTALSQVNQLFSIPMQLQLQQQQ